MDIARVIRNGRAASLDASTQFLMCLRERDLHAALTREARD